MCSLTTTNLRRSWIQRACLCAAFCWATGIVLSALAQEPPPPADALPREAVSADDVEILTRGPVHEAFAEPLASDPEAGLIIAQQPPEEIDEVAPDFKPEGDDVVWISGYWAWDDDRDNFLWVSGIWRKLPPGRRWIPGYWDDVVGGWQWTPGLWVPDEQDELVYRVSPPESLETGPNTPPPNDSYFWVPGCWMWNDIGYRWRPGYWHPYQENWVWVPAHWMWTPSGCLYVAGYWDYRVSTRGQLFAPVVFRRSGWYRTHYYSPTCVVESTPLLIHFWVRPRYSHYYFGDYYGPSYSSWGLSPWCRWHSRPGHWDPLLTHYDVHYRHHDHFDYSARMSHWHSHYDSHIDDRPRRTFHDQQQFAVQLGSRPSQFGQQALLGLSLTSAVSRTDRPVALKPVTHDHKQLQFRESKQLREFTRERAKSEKFAKLNPAQLGADNKQGPVGDPKDKSVALPKTEALKVEPLGNDKPKGDDKPKKIDTAKTTDSPIKPKPDEPGKSGDSKDDKADIAKRATRGSLKLPKPTTTTSKVAAEAPKVPTQAATPQTIDAKDLPKVDRSKLGPRNSERNSFDPRGKSNDNKPNDNKPNDNKPNPKFETPNVKPPKGEPKPQPQPKVDSPKVDAPKPQPQPKVELPKNPPKVETPKPQPKVDPPKPPKVETPRPQPRVESPKPPKADPPKRSDPPKKNDNDNKPKRGSK